jgi:hypothetical protein
MYAVENAQALFTVIMTVKDEQTGKEDAMQIPFVAGTCIASVRI